MSVLGAIFPRAQGAEGKAAEPEWWKSFVTTPSASGVRVTEQSAMEFSPVWNAVNIIAGAVGMLPLVLYRRVERGKERAPEHPVYRLLHDRPNPYMDSLTFRETLTGHALMWGNGYAEIEVDGGGRPVALWPLLPNRMQPKVVGKRVVYVYTDPLRESVTLAHDRVFHVKGLGGDGLKGYSVIRFAADGLGLGMAADKFGAGFFKNNAVPGGVLEHPGALSPEAKTNLRRSWEENHGGLDQSHRVAILEEGMKWTAIGIPAKDAQLLDTRKFQVGDVARWFDIPVHMLKELSRATFSNIEHQGIEFLSRTLTKWLCRWEFESSYKLLTEAERAAHYAEFVTEALLRADTLTRYRAHGMAIKDGWMSRNEVRVTENRNTEEGLDEFLEPMNMRNPGEQAKLDQAVDQMRPVLEAAFERVLAREEKAVVRARKKHADDDDALGRWADEFFAGSVEVLVEALGPGVAPIAEALGLGSEAAAIAVEAFAAEHMADCSRFVTNPSEPVGAEGLVDYLIDRLKEAADG